jgi:hypothetical protein
MAYGDIYARGVRGVVLETFGVGNMPDLPIHGWLPWLRSQRRKGLQVYLASQCGAGSLHPELYRSGSLALELGVQAGPQSACPGRLSSACMHACSLRACMRFCACLLQTRQRTHSARHMRACAPAPQ